ncbi:MAG: DUF4040 domain-containing protein [Clostridiales bacterium]|nr:DUF4040 domain-containing protein [Clostridiales bacterium]
MQILMGLLLGFLLVCAVSVSASKSLLNSVCIYMSYSLVMSIIWILLESPDLAITEAAVGAGITSILFFVTLKKIHAIVSEDDDLEPEGGADTEGTVPTEGVVSTEKDAAKEASRA